MAYEINFCETKEQLKHLAEVASGKVDGSPSGADIDESTLSYTGQVRRTLPKLIGQFDQQRAILDAEAEDAINTYRRVNAGFYNTSPYLDDKFTYTVYQGDRFYPLNPPYQTQPGSIADPNTDPNLVKLELPDEQFVVKVAGDGDSKIAGGKIWPLSSQEIAQPGQTVDQGVLYFNLSEGLYELSPSVGVDNVVDIIDEANNLVTFTLGATSAIKKVGTDKNIEVSYYALQDGTDQIVAFQRAANAARDLNRKLVANGDFTVNGTLTLYTDTDFSNANITYDDNARIIIEDSRGAASKLSLTASDFDLSKLTRGQLDLSTAFNNLSILNDWSNSHIIFSSDDVYINRFNAGVWTPQLQRCPSFMAVGGKLTKSLMFPFTSPTNLAVTLYKLPEKRITVNLGDVNFVTPNYYQFILINRSLVSLSVSKPQNPELVPNTTDFARFCEVGEVYGTHIRHEGESLSRIVETQSKYDFLMNGAVDTYFDNCFCPRSRRFIDGNNAIGIYVNDSTIRNIGSHFATADIKVTNSTVISSGQFGTGSEDTEIVYDKCHFLFLDGEANLFGVRFDYAELRGNFKVLNSTIDIRGAADVCYLFSASEAPIWSSGSPNPDQPRNDYRQCSLVEFDGITLISRAGQRLEHIRNRDGNAYPIDKEIALVEKYRFANFNLRESLALMRLSHGVISYDNQLTTIEMENYDTFVETKYVALRLGYSVGSGNPNDIRYKFKATKVPLGTETSFGTDFINGSDDCRINIKQCSIGTGWNMFTQGTYTGQVYWHKNTYRFTDDLSRARFSFNGKYRSITECVFDGSQFLVGEGSKPTIEQFAEVSRNNTAIDCKTNGYDHTPISNSYSNGGIQRLITQEGEPFNYETSGSDIVPTWDIGITTTRTGLIWEWYDGSGNKRAKNNTPPASITDGVIIIANPF